MLFDWLKDGWEAMAVMMQPANMSTQNGIPRNSGLLGVQRNVPNNGPKISQIVVSLFEAGASSSYTTPTGTVYLYPYAIGPGGNGSAGNSGGAGFGGAGGGGGAKCEKVISNPLPSYAYAVGGSGTGTATTFGTMSACQPVMIHFQNT